MPGKCRPRVPFFSLCGTCEVKPCSFDGLYQTITGTGYLPKTKKSPLTSKLRPHCSSHLPMIIDHPPLTESPLEGLTKDVCRGCRVGRAVGKATSWLWRSSPTDRSTASIWCTCTSCCRLAMSLTTRARSRLRRRLRDRFGLGLGRCNLHGWKRAGLQSIDESRRYLWTRCRFVLFQTCRTCEGNSAKSNPS